MTPTAQHCGRYPHRVSPSSAWPLRNSAGLTWAEVRSAASTKAPSHPAALVGAQGTGEE